MKNSNKKVNIASALALALVFLSGAAWASVMEDTVATVNGTPIMLTEYKRQFDSAMSDFARTEPQAMRDPVFIKKLRDQTLEQLIDNEVLYQEADKQKIKAHDRDVDAGVDEIQKRFQTDENGQQLTEAQAEEAFHNQLKKDGLSYAQFREQIRKQVTIRKLIEDQIKSKLVAPDADEVKDYFNKVKAYIVSGSTVAPKDMDDESAAAFMQIAQQVKTMSSERVRLSRILVRLAPGASDNEKKRALKTINQILQELNTSTQTFADIARMESEDPLSAPRGGDLGFLVKGVAPPAMEKAAFSLPVGELSKPILTDDGYNILRVEAHLAANPPELDQFQDDLSKFMMNLTFQKKVEEYVKSLKAKDIIERNLPEG